MGDEEGKREKAVGGAVGVVVKDPEKGPKDAIDVLLEYTEDIILRDMLKVLIAVGLRTEAGSVPDMKFMTEFAAKLRALKALPKEEYESFAAVLWKEYQAMEARERNS